MDENFNFVQRKNGCQNRKLIFLVYFRDYGITEITIFLKDTLAVFKVCESSLQLSVRFDFEIFSEFDIVN